MSSGNNHYVNGAAFERRVKAKLESAGWTVFRTAGSHSPADLIGLWPVDKSAEDDTLFSVAVERVILVQCKGGAKGMGPKAKREFSEFAFTHAAGAVLVERGMKFTLLERSAA